MHFCIGFFIIFDKNLFKMKNIRVAEEVKEVKDVKKAKK